MTRENFVPFVVTNDMIRDAKRLRKERDKIFKINVMEPGKRGKPDRRWVGELGEGVFSTVLVALRTEHEWFKYGDIAGKEDFLVAGHRLDIKTTLRTTYPKKKDDYTVGIFPRGLIHENIDDFFFMWYEEPRQRMWLVGMITRSGFIDLAKFYKRGDTVPGSGMVTGEDTWQISIKELVYPRYISWLRGGSK